MLTKESPISQIWKDRLLTLNKGDILKIVTGSGGGFGNPKKRKRERIIEDVENGFISKETAKKIYNFKS